MSLIVQDPLAPTTTANSYVSLSDARTRALFLGVQLPTDDDKATSALFEGAQYVDAKCYQGKAVIDFQGTAMPRTGVMIGGAEYPSDQIPQDFIDAQIYSAVAAGVGGLWSSEKSGQNIKREKVASLEVEYTDSGKQSGAVSVGRADSLLYKYTCSAGGHNFFMVV